MPGDSVGLASEPRGYVLHIDAPCSGVTPDEGRHTACHAWCVISVKSETVKGLR